MGQSREQSMVSLCVLPALVLVLSPALSTAWCTGENSCDTEHLYQQVQGVHSATDCQDLCEGDGRCKAYTWWRDTSLVHWSQCWLFTQCEETQCAQCVSGSDAEDCSTPGPDTTTPPPHTLQTPPHTLQTPAHLVLVEAVLHCQTQEDP